jgi:hypothetical protein
VFVACEQSQPSLTYALESTQVEHRIVGHSEGRLISLTRIYLTRQINLASEKHSSLVDKKKNYKDECSIGSVLLTQKNVFKMSKN